MKYNIFDCAIDKFDIFKINLIYYSHYIRIFEGEKLEKFAKREASILISRIATV